MTKIAAIATAIAITTTTGLATTTAAQAHHAPGYFGVTIGNPHFSAHFGAPVYHPQRVCRYKTKRRWSNRKGRYIYRRKRVCWYQ